MIFTTNTENINDFTFPKDILSVYLKNCFIFLFAGYQIVLKQKTYSLKRDSKTLENDIRDDIFNEAVILLAKAGLKERDNEFLQFSLYNENRDPSDKDDVKRFDISLSYHSAQYYRDIIVECKRLKKNIKNAAYIENGIERFEINRYGYGLPIAGMIGFIEEGNQELIVKDLTKRIDKKSTTSQSLEKLENTSDVFHKTYENHIFNSSHQRTDDLDDIEIFHLMMDFTSIINP